MEPICVDTRYHFSIYLCILTKVIFNVSNSNSVSSLSLWKNSFEMVNRDLGLVKRKKRALDELLATAAISQSTYEALSRELTEGLSYLESQQRSLVEKIRARAGGLERQIGTLELFLANLEIHHVAGEIDGESYNRQSQAIILGLEATKNELIEMGSLLAAVTSAERTELEASVEAEAPTAEFPASFESEGKVPEAESVEDSATEKGPTEATES